MFGRVRRQSMRSLEELEMEERYSSKIIKHDSISIYEATLIKLKEGSRRDLSQVQEEPATTDTSTSIAGDSAERETIVPDINSSSAYGSMNSEGSQDIGLLKDLKNQNISVMYLFSKYRISQQAMEVDSESSSASNSPCSDDYQLSGSSRQNLSEKIFSSALV